MVKKLKLKKKNLKLKPPFEKIKVTAVEHPPQEQPRPQQEMQEQSPVASSPPSSASLPTDLPPPTHFDDLINAAQSQPIGEAAPVMLGRDDFHKLFLTGFKVGHGLSRLQSLNIAPEDPAARECAFAIHDCIVDIPAMHFMLQPQNKWLERVVAIGTFTIPLAASVKAELRERRAEAKNHQTEKACA